MWKLAVVPFAICSLTDSKRSKYQDVQLTDFDAETEGADDLVMCNAAGLDSSPQSVGMSVSWGVPKKKCMAECGPTGATANEWTYQREFTNALTVTMDTRCECTAGGKALISFKPNGKVEASECQAGSHGMQKLCWELYTKARGCRFEKLGNMFSPVCKTPYTPSDFEVQRKCGEGSTACGGDTGVSCNKLELPGVLDGYQRPEKLALGEAIKKVMDETTEDVSDELMRFIKTLPPRDLDSAEFEAIDADGDGHLSLNELTVFYTKFTEKQIKIFMDEADADGNGEIEGEEFYIFKDRMRSFNPDVDLITGDVEFKVGADGEVEETEAKWKVVQVECQKGGKAAEGCSGTPDEAIARFNMGA